MSEVDGILMMDDRLLFRRALSRDLGSLVVEEGALSGD